MPEDRTNKVSCNNYQEEFEVAFELLSGKWIPLLLWNLQDGEAKRFADLRRIHSKITPKMLSQQLRVLEYNGLVIRNVLPEVPPAVEYSLSPSGKALIPVIHAMQDWSMEFLGSAPKRGATGYWAISEPV